MKAQYKLNRINCSGQGVKARFFEYEEEIVNYIFDKRKSNIPVTKSMVIGKIGSLYDEFNRKTRFAQLLSVYRLLKRNNLSLKRTSHLGQTLI